MEPPHLWPCQKIALFWHQSNSFSVNFLIQISVKCRQEDKPLAANHFWLDGQRSAPVFAGRGIALRCPVAFISRGQRSALSLRQMGNGLVSEAVFPLLSLNHEYLDPLQIVPHDGVGIFHLGSMAAVDLRLFAKLEVHAIRTVVDFERLSHRGNYRDVFQQSIR